MVIGTPPKQSAAAINQNQPKMSKVNSFLNSRFWKLSFGRRNTLCVHKMLLA